MKMELKERSIGELIGQTFSLTAAHYFKLLAITLIVNLPIQGLSLWSELTSRHARSVEEQAGAQLTGAILTLILSFLLPPLAAGASILLVASSFVDTDSSLLGCLRIAWKRLLSLLAASFTVGLVVGLGFLLLVIPGIIFFTMFSVTTPALMVEDVGYRDAMTRSRTLTYGSRLSILGYFIVTIILVQAIGGAVSGVLQATLRDDVVAAVFGLLAICLLSPISTVAPVALYFNLRVKKEALDAVLLSSLVDAIAERGAAAQ